MPSKGMRRHASNKSSVPSLFLPGIKGPQWRWELARVLAAKPGRPNIAVDALVLAAADFIRADPKDKHRPRYRHLASAVSMYESNGPPKWQLEATILTGLSTGQVARKAGLEVAVLRVYEEMFFDVRPRLQAPSWIAAHTFGLKPLTGFDPDDLGPLWRWVGYRRGEYALDLVYAVTTGAGRDRYPAEDLEAAELFVLTSRLKPSQTPERLLQLELRLKAQEVGAHASAYHLTRRAAAREGGAKKVVGERPLPSHNGASAEGG